MIIVLDCEARYDTDLCGETETAQREWLADYQTSRGRGKLPSLVYWRAWISCALVVDLPSGTYDWVTFHNDDVAGAFGSRSFTSDDLLVTHYGTGFDVPLVLGEAVRTGRSVPPLAKMANNIGDKAHWDCAGFFGHSAGPLDGWSQALGGPGKAGDVAAKDVPFLWWAAQGTDSLVVERSVMMYCRRDVLETFRLWIAQAHAAMPVGLSGQLQYAEALLAQIEHDFAAEGMNPAEGLA